MVAVSIIALQLSRESYILLPLSIVIEVKPEQPSNALSIRPTEFDNVISVKPVQLLNARSPIVILFLPIVLIEVSPVQSENAPDGI